MNKQETRSGDPVYAEHTRRRVSMLVTSWILNNTILLSVKVRQLNKVLFKEDGNIIRSPIVLSRVEEGPGLPHYSWRFS